MNAITPINTCQAEFGQSSEFYTLCGQLTRHYARIEFDVVRVIERLDPDGKVPPTLSQRIARLKVLIQGDTKRISKDIAKSLDELETHFGRRNTIVHGTGATASRGKGWLWPWEMKAGSKAAAERGYWTDQEMRNFQADLKSKADRLHSHVERLCEGKPA